ncbi:hypothetical protein DFP72DRAFT_852570 [Ephemerocybe angulata]|uniref:BTB domain-containing protein n=1 Tax=Ephemerocybe angulata TaxID=980116 RepID=A0A8H6HPB1_9AGAR|nr:hypothetical protein DFP72DRAFT_852570 [Tulosesus angulatus]
METAPQRAVAAVVDSGSHLGVENLGGPDDENMKDIVDPQPPTRSAEVWFDDGNVVLQAEGVLFKIHRGIFIKHSAVLEDMLAELPLNGGIKVEGCSVINLEDIEHWKRAPGRGIIPGAPGPPSLTPALTAQQQPLGKPGVNRGKSSGILLGRPGTYPGWSPRGYPGVFPGCMAYSGGGCTAYAPGPLWRQLHDETFNSSKGSLSLPVSSSFMDIAACSIDAGRGWSPELYLPIAL